MGQVWTFVRFPHNNKKNVYTIRYLDIPRENLAKLFHIPLSWISANYCLQPYLYIFLKPAVFDDYFIYEDLFKELPFSFYPIHKLTILFLCLPTTSKFAILSENHLKDVIAVECKNLCGKDWLLDKVNKFLHHESFCRQKVTTWQFLEYQERASLSMKEGWHFDKPSWRKWQLFLLGIQSMQI